jgi:hypothetical protein
MRLLLATLIVAALSYPADAADDPSAKAGTGKIVLRVGGKVLAATLVDSPTSRDFVSLLPLTIPMRDLFGREKFGDLPRAISEGGERTRTYRVGDVIYWSPSAHLAIYYRQDGETIPLPGVIVIAHINAGAEVLNVPGSVTVTIEAEEKR